ncbi:Myc-type, basic helix-loop-helix domain-containing protein, partial [Tanacetum coccineum]
ITTAAIAAGHRPPVIAVGTTADHLLWSVCKLLGKEVYTSLNTDVKQKVTWYVLNNSPEIDTDIVAYKNAFSSNNVEKEFPRWINDEIRQKRVNNDPSCTLELFSLACGPSSNATLYTAYLVNGVRFMELTYIGCNKVVLFGCKWFDISNVKHFYIKDNIKHINTSSASTALYRNQPYILATQARQVFYHDDPARLPLHWKVVEDVNHTKKWHRDTIEIEDNEDAIHDNTSSDVALSADLDDLDFANMDDVAIDIRDNEEDFVVDSDDEVESVRVEVYSSGRSHGGDAGGEPPREPNRIPNQCEGVFRLATTFKRPDHNNRSWQAAYSGEAREKPPPNDWKRSAEEWQELIDF